MNTSTTAPGAVDERRPSRTVWLIAGVLAAASVAAGAGMLMRESTPAPVGSVSSGEAPAAKVAAKPAAQPAAPKQAVVATCRDCGVVESVHTVKRKGEASGLGAVAGGVLGAAVGNQVGGGNGRKAMTVIGAVGGGVAGHEIEKQAKSVTVHQVKVRMDDGSLRTIEQSQAPRVGERVAIEGNRLRAAPV